MMPRNTPPKPPSPIIKDLLKLLVAVLRSSRGNALRLLMCVSERTCKEVVVVVVLVCELNSDPPDPPLAMEEDCIESHFLVLTSS